MDVGRVSGLDGTRRETSFQASVIAANAKPPANVESNVSQMASRSRGAADDYAIDQRCGPNSGTEREQNDVSPSPSRAPKHLADQGRARVIVGDRVAGHPRRQVRAANILPENSDRQAGGSREW